MEYRVRRINNGDELMHKKQHKYINKIRMKNGKYRYIYDVIGFDERDRYEKAKKDYDAAYKKWMDAEDAYVNIGDEMDRVLEKNRYRNGYHTISSQSQHLLQQYKRAYDRLAKSGENSDRASEEEDNASYAYQKTPLYKLEEAASKGVSFLNKLFKR